MSKEKRLGRGLEALLGKVAATAIVDEPQESHSYEDSFSSSYAGTAVLDDDLSNSHRVDERHSVFPHPSLREPQNAGNAPELGIDTPLPQRNIDILSIDKNPYQPRLVFDQSEIDSLAESIQTHGLLQPIVVRKLKDRYQLIAGERRLRAALQAGWQDIPAHVLDVTDQQMAELALTENMQRRDLNAIEKATAFQRYLEIYGGTQEELAKRLGFDRTTITNIIRLLQLPEEVRDMVQRNEITSGHARAILPLKEDWELIDIAVQIRDEGWSVRQTEQYVTDLQNGIIHEDDWGKKTKAATSRKPQVPDDQTASLEQDFRNTLGSKVKLTHNNQGRGKIVIPFATHDEFDRIYQIICQPKKKK